jgi:polysaccharide chain length determinant protein (PEP-CTERM system associated)
MEEQSLRPSDIKRVFQRRARLAIVLAGVCTLLGILIAAVLPNRYQAETTLLVEPQSISRSLVDSGVDEKELGSRLHLMTMQILSRSRLARIIDDLKLYPDLAEEKTREDVIAYMRSQIWVEPVLPALQTDPKARGDAEVNTFRLYFRHDSPGTAAAVANRLASDFIDEHIRDRVQVSGDTAEFIEAELNRLSQRIREVDNQIARIKGENAGSLPEDRAANETLQQRSLDALREAERIRSEAESDATFYRQQATMIRGSESGRDNIVGRTVSPAVRAQEIEMRLSELRSRGLTDRHPDVVAATAELDGIRARIAESGAEPGAAPSSIAEQEALGLSQRAALRAESQTALIERLREELQATQDRIARTPLVAEQLDGLAREYESLSSSIRDYSNKRLEAQVSANMERRQKGEQFRVLEPAFPPSDPESPNRPLIVILGVLLGLALGGGIAVVLEAVDNSVHDSRGLQDRLRIPVLVTIPKIRLRSDVIAQRRRRMREAMAAAAVSGLVLFVSAVGYVYVNKPGLWPGSDRGQEAVAPPAPAVPAPAAPAPVAAPVAPTPVPGE